MTMRFVVITAGYGTCLGAFTALKVTPSRVRRLRYAFDMPSICLRPAPPPSWRTGPADGHHRRLWPQNAGILPTVTPGKVGGAPSNAFSVVYGALSARVQRAVADCDPVLGRWIQR